MVEDETSFREKIRNSFSNVKNDIFSIDTQLKTLQGEAKDQKEDISKINSKLETLNSSVTEIKDILKAFKTASTGNDGVINNHQQSTINNHQQSTINSEHPKISQKDLKDLEKDFSQLFKNLTDREFSVFMAIFELEKQLIEANYTQIANRLNLTETTVRGTVNRLISKNLPVTKERLFNGKTSLSLKKDFHDLNLLQKLIRLRQNPTDQKTLFE